MGQWTDLARWKVKIALVRWLNGRNDAGLVAYQRLMNEIGGNHHNRWNAFVDRVSPWVGRDYKTYRRALLRRALYHVRFPLGYARYHLGGWAGRRLARLAPLPGRYEGNDPVAALKAEWFDSHLEYAYAETGDTDTYIHVALFVLVPPWSRNEESWLMTTDSRGFVEISDRNAVQRFADYDLEYRAIEAGVDDTSGFREGQPEFNGAFR